MSPSSELFPSTIWTVVLQAAGEDPESARVALMQLCERYGSSIRVCMLARAPDPHTAEDLSQQFLSKLLSADWLAAFARQPESRFRAFLHRVLDNFFKDWLDEQNALKRGRQIEHITVDLPTEDGGARPATPAIEPGRILDREIALTIHDRALRALDEDFSDSGKRPRYLLLKPCILGETPIEGFASIGKQLGITANAVRQELFRLRDRYYDLFRGEVSQIVNNREMLIEEMRYLVSLLPDEYGSTGHDRTA